MTDLMSVVVFFSLLLFLIGWGQMQDRNERIEAAAQESRFELLDPDNHEEVSNGSNIYYRVNVKKETSDD